MNFDDFSLLVTCFNKQEFILHFNNQVETFLKNQAQVVIVDDGSTDQSIELLSPILEKYQNCRVIRTENRGSAAARNLTLSNLNTEYFMFWDIDDDIDTERVFEALNIFRNTKADCAVTNFVSVPENIPGAMPKNVTKPEIVEMSSIAPQILDAVGYWRYLYKKSFTIDKMCMRFVPTRNEIKNSRFILDDLFWVLEISQQTARLLVFPAEFVTYKYRTNSIQSQDSWTRYQNQVVDLPDALKAFDNYLNLKKLSKSPDRYRLYSSTLIQHFSYLNFKQKIQFLIRLTNNSLTIRGLFQMMLKIYPSLLYNLLRHAVRSVLTNAKLR